MSRFSGKVIHASATDPHLTAALRSLDDPLAIRAFLLAQDRHAAQRRATGELYFLHPLRVAGRLVLCGGFDALEFVGALCHDLLEDTKTNADDILATFDPYGEEVLQTVVALTELKTLSRNERKAEHLARAASFNVRTRRIKAADMLDNMNSLLPKVNEDRRRELIQDANAWIEALGNVDPFLGLLRKAIQPYQDC